jgi:hypothetical protein
MQTKRLITGLVLGLGLALALLWLLKPMPSAADADAIRCVKPGGGGGCYASIQTAVTAANAGDTIRVAQGTYLETVLVTKSLTLEGGWNTGFTSRNWNIYTTTINAQRAGSVIRIDGSVSPTIEGFVITGGDASAYLGWGGGILADGDWGEGGMIAIRHNVITDNIACNGTVSCQGYGGGIMIYSNRATIEYNTVISNAARTGGSGSGQGGGISLWGFPSEVTLTGNVVVSNTAVFSLTGMYSVGEGGGVWSEGACAIIAFDNEIRGNVAAVKGEGYGGGAYACGEWYANRILSNTASITAGLGYGGGVYAHYVPDFNDNLVQGNVASQGGDGSGGGVYAIYLREAQRNTIVDNAATRGGGVYFREYTGQQTFSGNLVARNWATGLNIGTLDGGGGIASEADRVEITGNDILTNAAFAGGGVLVTAGDRYLVQDNLLKGNWAFGGGGLFVYSATGTIARNQVVGNVAVWWGGGMYLSGKAGPLMDGNVVVSNTAGGTGGAGGFAGGGLILDVGAGTRITLTNHVIARNTILTGTAAGVHCLSGACALIHCTIVDNRLGSGRGEGVRISALGGPNVVWNSIIAGHSVGVSVTAGSAVLGYNDYYDNIAGNVSGASPGAHSRTDDPQFADRAAGDYHLTSASLLIDHGDSGVSVPRDFEGDPRLVVPDIGADEYIRAHVYLPLVLRNFSEYGPGYSQQNQ